MKVRSRVRRSRPPGLWDVVLGLGFAVAGFSAASTYDGSLPATVALFVLAAFGTLPLAVRCLYPMPVRSIFARLLLPA